MQFDHRAFAGIRKEIREFMRSSETVLSLASMESLTDEEAEIIGYYAQWLSEKSGDKAVSSDSAIPPLPPD
ncbi:MAG: hypothetical protein AB7G68_12085 [Nitrospiraceae bacterium]